MHSARLLLSEGHFFLVSAGRKASLGSRRCPALAASPNLSRGPQRSRTLFARACASMAAAKPTTDLRVCTYNVLSSNLGGPDYYTACNPDDLHAPTRLKRVLARLAREVDAGAVVCLQEVSISWAGPLHTFFQSRGYSLVSHLYSPAFQGFMGVGIAYDAKRFTLVDCDISRVSDAKKWPRPPPQGPVRRLLSRGWGLASSAFWAVAKLAGKRPAEDPLAHAKRRVNAMVFLRLRDNATGAVFGVATYHMPCAFRTPAVMAVHMALCAQRAFAVARGCPFVLCGDFNIQPDTEFYRLYQTGTYERGAPSYPALPAYDKWTPDLPGPLRSAYAECHGAEPDFTNFAKIKADEPFIGTLDYIFIRDGNEGAAGAGTAEAADGEGGGRWEVAGADALPNRSEVKGPYPSSTEPSDHVAVAATLRLVGGAVVAGAAAQQQ